jgi:hypothetical protein
MKHNGSKLAGGGCTGPTVCTTSPGPGSKECTVVLHGILLATTGRFLACGPSQREVTSTRELARTDTEIQWRWKLQRVCRIAGLGS